MGLYLTEQILRINMEKQETSFEEVPEEYEILGGRGLTSNIVAEEVPSKCHPLGPNNKLVIAPGIVTGTSAPTSGRISVGGKSPLTEGIKESNAGTSFGQKLSRLQIKAIIIEGKPDNDNYYLLKIDKEGAELKEVNQLVGEGLYSSYKNLRSSYGEDIGICGVGIAAEMKASNAGVAFNDPEGRPSRFSGRGGLGSVMASRGMKFIVVDEEDAPGVEIEDRNIRRRSKKVKRRSHRS